MSSTHLHLERVGPVSPRKRLPPGIRHRAAVYTYTWRDQTGRQTAKMLG